MPSSRIPYTARHVSFRAVRLKRAAVFNPKKLPGRSSNLIWIQCEYFEIALFIEFWRKYYDGFRLGSIIISKWGCNTLRSLRWPSFHPVVLRCSSNVFVAGFSISSHTTGQLPQTTSSQIIAQDSPHNYHQWPKSPNQSSRSRGLIRLDVNEVTEEVAALVEFLNTHLAY